MSDVMKFLSGKKTYIVALVAACLAFAQSMGYEIPEWIYPLLGALGIGTLRAGVAKRVAVLVLCASLAACGSLPGGMMSPGTAGAPATASNLAQTVGNDQASVPGTATGGTAAINYYMASAVPPAVTEAILALAADQKWTAEQVESALRAAAGAPQTVTITGNATNQGGDADNAGAGSGGASGLAGTSGSVSRP